MYIFLLASFCFLVSLSEHINKSPSSKHIFEATCKGAEDCRVNAAHEKQERLWATNAMGMHIGIDDVEEVYIKQLLLLVKRKSKLVLCAKPWRTAKTPKTL